VDAHARIGEAPVWDADRRRLLWTDHELGRIYEIKLNGADGWTLDRMRPLQQPIAAVLPSRDGRLLVAAGQKIFLLDDDGSSTPLARLPPEAGASAFNEAKTDRQGRLWAGTLAGDFKPGGAALYRLDEPGQLTTVVNNVTVSNGMDWSPDGNTFYYIDSVTLAVDAFDMDPATGGLDRRRRLITIEPGAGAPDGMTVDAEGCLWIAVAGSGEVRRYSPEGTLLSSVRISPPGVTSCAFGGPLLDHLFITCLGRRLPDVFLSFGLHPDVLERSETAPGAGGLFVCQPGPCGIPVAPFAL
jgi:sugar lactone lactonase YvrE